MRRWCVVLLFLIARRADAAWYYTYTCTGECAANRLANSYTSDPYPSEADCEAARSSDPNNVSGSGNLGVLSYCAESDTPPVPGHLTSIGRVPTQSVSLALYGGAGYTWAGHEGLSGMLGGVEGTWVVGARPGFGIVARTGIRFTRVTEGTVMPAMQPEDQMWFVPLQVGLTAAFGNSHIRWELGFDIGWDIAAHCTESCPTALLGSVRTGIVIYSKHASSDGEHRGGIGIELVHEGRGDSDDSGAIHAPSLQTPVVMLRVSMRRRNDMLNW